MDRGFAGHQIDREPVALIELLAIGDSRIDLVC
jgi:hypothetical protein